MTVSFNARRAVRACVLAADGRTSRAKNGDSSAKNQLRSAEIRRQEWNFQGMSNKTSFGFEKFIFPLCLLDTTFPTFTLSKTENVKQ